MSANVAFARVGHLASFRVAEEVWTQRAACRGMDPDLFHPDRGDGGGEDSTAAVAKSVCAACPVSEQCLEYALRTRQNHGIWGGKSERERRKIRRKMLAAAAEARRMGARW